MENTYIISDNSEWRKYIITGLNLSDKILSYEELSTEVEFDNWISQNIKSDVSCLIIPLEFGKNSQNSVQGLRIAMHIRLMQSEVRYLPIVFISNRQDWQIRQILRDSYDEDHLDYIIGTNGTDLLRPNIDEIRAVVENIKPLNKENYKLDFYNNIHILPRDAGHSFANIWGALRLNEVLNLNAITDESLTNRTKELYFKYLRAFHENNPNTDETKISHSIVCTYEEKDETDKPVIKQRKILLIDDEADKGWKDVLGIIFKDAGDSFQVISDFSDIDKGIDEATKRATKEDWDLILLDLRLNPSEEDTGDKLIKTEEYSGAKILKAIKDHNAGIQVIMLTASNKAWNMKKLLDLGADGYYIKESPEFNFSATLTKENYDNFEKQVEACFERDFLRGISIIQDKCEIFIDSDYSARSRYHKLFYDRAKSSLLIAFELLKKSSNEPKYLNLAYLTYFQILEDYTFQRDNFEYNKTTRDCVVKPLKTNPTNLPIKVIDGNTNEWKLELVEKDKTNQLFNYFKIETKTNTKEWTTLVKISFLLAFKFGKDNDYLKKWGKLNHLRNTKAGHGGNGGFVTIEEIKELLEIVELFLTNQ